MEGLGRRILIAAFDGWNDAGEAASSALTQLRSLGEYRQAFSVDPELYFDYQYTRPTLKTDNDGRRVLEWPKTTVERPAFEAEPVELWLLRGVEPARAWQSFASELTDFALRDDITGFIGIGSMMADVPHTRPISVFGSSDNDRIRGELELERSTYEGPVGMLTVLAQSFEAVGIPTATLWANVPHYVATHTPSPKATLALLDKLEPLTGVTVPRGTLPVDAAAWEASIDAAAADDEDMTEYIRALEKTRDTWDSPDASGDAIAREFEQYLRRNGEGPNKPGPPERR